MSHSTPKLAEPKYSQAQHITYNALFSGIQQLPTVAAEICQRIEEDTAQTFEFGAEKGGKYFLFNEHKKLPISLVAKAGKWEAEIILKYGM